MEMQLILAAPPEFAAAAAKLDRSVAHMVYRIGRDMHLYRAEQATNRCQGDLMVVDDRCFTGRGNAAALAAEILGERNSRGYGGIVLSFENTTAPLLHRLTALLQEAAGKQGFPLYVPSGLHTSAPGATVLVTTALSGGTLARHLSDAVESCGAAKIALEVERCRMDFLLPAKQGVGLPLSQEELRDRIRRFRRQSFFSRELCAWYFTYQDGADTHFVLYDNAASIRQKLQTAARLGIATAFLCYPEVADILPELLR